MTASCPQCTGPVQLMRETGNLVTAGWRLEKYHCDRCKVSIAVEYQIVPDPSPETQGVNDAES